MPHFVCTDSAIASGGNGIGRDSYLRGCKTVIYTDVCSYRNDLESCIISIQVLTRSFVDLSILPGVRIRGRVLNKHSSLT
jgi:hypothetical protein